MHLLEERIGVTRRRLTLGMEVGEELEGEEGSKRSVLLLNKSAEELQACHVVHSLQLHAIVELAVDFVGEVVRNLQGLQ